MSNGVPRPGKFLKVYEPGDFVVRRKAGGEFVLVLVDPPHDIARDSRIKGPRTVGHEVNEEPLSQTSTSIAPTKILRCAQDDD